MTRIIGGKSIAAAVGEEVGKNVARLAARGLTPELAVFLATDDPGASWYVCCSCVPGG